MRFAFLLLFVAFNLFGHSENAEKEVDAGPASVDILTRNAGERLHLKIDRKLLIYCC